MLTLGIALAGTPQTETLLESDIEALPTVFCRSESGRTLERGGTHWQLRAPAGNALGPGPGQNLLREVLGPATRTDREGDVWSWTERIAVRDDGGALATLFDDTTLDEAFTCVDTSDPDSRWFDVDGAYATVPRPGVNRCRSLDRRWVVISQSYTGGARPGPDTITSSLVVVKDGLSVAYSQVRGGRTAGVGAPAISPLSVDWGQAQSTKTDGNGVTRTRRAMRVRWQDGRPIDGQDEIAGTFVCESKRYPPQP